MKRTGITLMILLTGAIALFAQNTTPRADARQKAQRARIAQGRASGELTPGEAAVLNRQQRHIRRVERRAKADGQVTAAEKAKIERKQNRASRNIRRAKNNRLDRN
jgi:hypothetical protein